jgi:hypothetical protein
MLTGLVAPKLKVGATALAGLERMVALSATLPVKPPAGVTVSGDALPVVAPGAIDSAVAVTESPGTGTLIVTEAVPVPAV